MKSKDVIRRLREFHSEHGYDVSLLFEDEPELYRAVLMRDASLRKDSIGSEFMKLVMKVTTNAKRDVDYRSSFDRRQQSARGKTATSIGFVANDDED